MNPGRAASMKDFIYNIATVGVEKDSGLLFVCRFRENEGSDWEQEKKKKRAIKMYDTAYVIKEIYEI